ncbi:Guanylate cyclase domain-containing protein [Balamuthia mandrillaris]
MEENKKTMERVVRGRGEENRSGCAAHCNHCQKTPEEMLAPYVPWMVKQRLLQRVMRKKGEEVELPEQEEEEAPRCFPFLGAVVFVDISGFTPLTEALCRSSAEKGGEIMHLVLKRFFTELLGLVEEYGGDVIKFAGDALLIAWSSQHDIADCSEVSSSSEGALQQNNCTSLESTVSLATRFATVASQFKWKLNMAEEEDSFINELAADKAIFSILQNATLCVKVGVSAGEVVAMQLGGVNGRWEYLLAGKPLSEIASTESDAAVSTVVVTSGVWSMLNSKNKQQPHLNEEKANEQEEESDEYVAVRFPSGNFLIRPKENEDFSLKQTTEKEGKGEEEQQNDQLLPISKFLPNVTVGDALFLALRIHEERARINHSISAMKQGANWMQGYVPVPLRKWLEEGHSLHHLADIRQTTVLFIELCGLDTSTIECFEPLQNALSCAQEVLFHYKGALRQFIVDDKGAVFVAVFGLPHMTLEDDAVRAVNAALVINLRLHELNLANSVGITTGRTFCGDVGSTKRCEYCVVGDSVNLSARLMIAAAKVSNGGKHPGAIFVDEQTYHIITESEGRFLLQPLDHILVKGKEKPIPIYTPAEGRRRSLREVINTNSRKMIGRKMEMRVLRNAFDTFMQDGNCFKAVLIKGQAGMGKTAMVRELLNWNEGGVLQIDGQAPEIEKNTPYYIWQEILSSAFAVSVMDELRASFHQHFKRFVTNNPKFEKYLAVLNPLLVTQFPETEGLFTFFLLSCAFLPYPFLFCLAHFVCFILAESKQLGTKDRRDKLHEILAWTLREFRRANGNRPIVLVLENCHWLDSASWNVITYMIDVKVPHGIFLVLTARPPQEHTPANAMVSCFYSCPSSSFSPFLTPKNEEVDASILIEAKEKMETLAANIKFLEEAHPDITVTITLDRMSNEQIAELAKVVMNRTELTKMEEEILFSKSQGNPMIAISLALTLPKLKLVFIGDICFFDPSTIHQLPCSVESVITSTVDKLSINQQIVLKVASVIGSRFSAVQLGNILEKAGKDNNLGQEQLVTELQALTQMGMLSVALDGDDMLYFFENPFVQKTIYGMLPFAERYEYHAIIADWYERCFSTNSASHYPVLAYHWHRAQDFSKAIRYYDLAGEFAFNNYAGSEASSSWLQAIKLYERLLHMFSSLSTLTPPLHDEQKGKEDKQPRRTVVMGLEKDSQLQLGRWYRMIGLAKGQVGYLQDSVNFTKKAVRILGMPLPDTDDAIDREISHVLKKVLVYHMYPSHFVGRRKYDPYINELLEGYKRLTISAVLLSWDNKIATLITLQRSCLAEQCNSLTERAFAYAYLLVHVNRFSNNWSTFAGYHWKWVKNLFQHKCNALIQQIDDEIQQQDAVRKEKRKEERVHKLDTSSSKSEKRLAKSLLETRSQVLIVGEPSVSLCQLLRCLEEMTKCLTAVGEHLESDSTKTYWLLMLYLQGELDKGIQLADELLENVQTRKYQTNEEAAIRMKTMILIRKGDWESVERYNKEMVDKKLHLISPSIHFAFLLRVASCYLANGQMDAVRANLMCALSLWEDTFLEQIRILAPLQLAFEESAALWEYGIAVRQKSRRKENDLRDETELSECVRRCEFVVDKFWKMSTIYSLGRCGAWYAQGVFFALSGMVEKAHRCWNHVSKLCRSAPNFLPVERALVKLAKARFPQNADTAKAVRQATAAMADFERMGYQPYAQQCKQLLSSSCSSSASSSSFCLLKAELTLQGCQD